MSLFVKKSVSQLMADAGDSEKGLKRTLGSGSLVALGIGAIIGAGLFVRTAAAAAQNAGPSVTLGFIVAAIGCALAGLCYAELSSSIPISGSAYTYTYATMGELMAWIIGWDLVLEYAVGAATVGIAWSEYLNNLLLQDRSNAFAGVAAILLDLNMHRVSGIDVLKYINAHPTLKRIPVIVFTTSSSKSDINLCYDLGAKAFVCKPLDIFEFNDTIKAIVDFWVGINIIG